MPDGVSNRDARASNDAPIAWCRSVWLRDWPTRFGGMGEPSLETFATVAEADEAGRLAMKIAGRQR